MFGSSKPVVLDRYGSRRSRRRLPSWLVLLLLGIGVGAAGVVLVQERYLPPRLSAAASTELRAAYSQADAERQRLAAELETATQQRAAAESDKAKLAAELADSRANAERQRGAVSALVAALPPDPRGGMVEIRAGKLAAKGGQLAYELVLTSQRSAARPLSGVLQLVVAGESSSGTSRSVDLKPIPLTIAGHEIARGSAPLPDGFKPRRVTIQVLDAPGGRVLGMRVLLVS